MEERLHSGRGRLLVAAVPRGLCQFAGGVRVPWGREKGPWIVLVRVTVTTAGSGCEPEPSSLSRALSRNVGSGESQYCR